MGLVMDVVIYFCQLSGSRTWINQVAEDDKVCKEDRLGRAGMQLQPGIPCHSTPRYTSIVPMVLMLHHFCGSILFAFQVYCQELYLIASYHFQKFEGIEIKFFRIYESLKI